MKKLFAFLLALVMVFSLAACGGAPAATEEPAEEPAEGGVELPAEDVAMQYMTADETLAILGEDGYTIIDLRKGEDYEAGHIPGSVLLSMDPAVNGDTDDGIATMKAGIEGVDDTLVLVCYSGKKYAQMGTNVLSALGYDMSKVYTLEGGFNNWIEVNPDSVETGAPAEVDSAPAEEAPAEEAAEKANVTGTVTYSIDMTKYDEGKVVRVWVPVAQTNDYQTVEDVAFDAGDAAADAELTHDEAGNAIIHRVGRAGGSGQPDGHRILRGFPGRDPLPGAGGGRPGRGHGGVSGRVQDGRHHR